MALRKYFSVKWSRILGWIIPVIIGIAVEFLQQRGIPIFGETYDPVDILMYAIGVSLSLALDLTVLEKLEGSVRQDQV